MVLSRCFHVWDGEKIKGGMVPFIDLINHDPEPNCKLVVGDDGQVCRPP